MSGNLTGLCLYISTKQWPRTIYNYIFIADNYKSIFRFAFCAGCFSGVLELPLFLGVWLMNGLVQLHIQQSMEF